ncbi:MAG: Gfo/Idh/MocA family oxidoreductase [Verrucomicrobiota bacterium]|jgi:predicted dehydrogenase
MNHTQIKSAFEGTNISRRRFLTAAGASAVTLAMLPSELAAETAAAEKINIGLIGCGARGQWIADLFRKHGGYNLVAVADYFQDKADAAGEAGGIPPERRFTSLSAYKRLLEQKLDAVVIESPAYFHPEHAAAAVAAGKHVYLAKPIAVDVPGCLTVESSARRATENKLCFLVDFQTRTLPDLQKIVEIVHQGGIGPIVSGEAAYQTGPVAEIADNERRADPKNPELRLRAWFTDLALSGGIITEQDIHSIDLACWLLDAAPLSAYGTGGKFRNFVGDNWDHFSLIYQFPKNVLLTFSSKQAGYGYDDIMCRIYGNTGTVDTRYYSKSTLRSTDLSLDADPKELYLSGVERNIATFHENITSRNYGNPTVAPSVHSTLATILGRMAAYRHTNVSWEQMMRHPEHLVPDLRGLKA